MSPVINMVGPDLPFHHTSRHLQQVFLRSTIFPPNTTTTSIRDPSRCDKISYDYEIIPAVVCSMCFLFGIVYTFFGYRFFKAVMFLTGFIFGTVLVYIICNEENILPPEANAGIAIAAGIICGLITMLVQYVGLFLTGFHLGIGLSTGVLVTVDQFYNITNKWIPIGVLIGVGILFALLILKFQKAGTILGTSIFGAALMVTCLDFFIEKFLIIIYIWESIKVTDSIPPCWYSWLVIGCWPFCFLVGTFTQWRITGQGFDHHELLHNKRVRKVNLQRIRAKQRRDQQHSRYRHLYQVRRFNGDVISQIPSFYNVTRPWEKAFLSMTDDPTSSTASSLRTTSKAFSTSYPLP